MRQLLLDTRENEEAVTSALATESAKLAAVDAFLNVVDGDGGAPPDTSLELWANVPLLLTGTYSGMIQTGDVQLLRNDTLRLRVISHADKLALAQEFLRQTMGQTWRNLETVFRTPPGDDDGITDEHVSAANMQRLVNQHRIDMFRGLEQDIREMRCWLESELESVGAVAIEPASTTIAIGETTRLEPRVRFGAGFELDGCVVSWAIDDEDVASVDEGVVTGVATGDARITATFRGASGFADISVEP